MIDLFYKNIIFKFSKIIILSMLLLTVVFFFSAINLKIDASSDTLILEKDKDLKYFQLLNKRYKSSEFLLIAFKPNEYLLSEAVKKNIKDIAKDLDKNSISINGIKVIGVKSLMNRLPLTASSLYAKNLFSFIRNLYSREKKDFNINLEDEIIKKSLIEKV